MENVTTQLKLVEGTFSSKDAKEIICALINSKITFHHHRIFSQEERFGIKDQQSLKRIKELQEAKTNIMQLTDQATESDLSLTIKSNISIEIAAEKVNI